MIRFSLSIIFLLLFTAGYSQKKVGLVLSGGAAKGIAHIGVLKALEENEIPIDYIVGTSMGGIVGGCYAAGMSPDLIEQIFLSNEFLGWINGNPEEGFNYHFNKSDDNPHFLKVQFSLDSTFNVQVSASLASDVALNFAMAEKMAQASAISNGNFDSLFIPLRVVAAEVFTQTEVVLHDGSLSDGLRATQTVPFFYEPIRVNGQYLFDGGVYNNFPVSVMQKDFDPDVIIGVNVSTKIYNEYPYGMDDKLISNSLLYLLLDKSDPTLISDSGVFIQPNLKGYTSFDFRRAKSLIDSGYAQTIRQLDEIKAKIPNRITCDEVAAKRNDFNDRNVPYRFNKIEFNGFSQKQQNYINRIFNVRKNKPRDLSYHEIKKGYYKLASDDYFKNVYPNIHYNPAESAFSFKLTRRPQKNFQTELGGVIATRDISNIFVGLNYYVFNNFLNHFYLGLYAGDFYKAAELKARIDLPFSNQVFIEPAVSYNNRNYLENDDLLVDADPTVLTREDRNYVVNIGWPLGRRFKTTVSVGGMNTRDRYSNRDFFISSDTLDVLRLRGGSLGFEMASNTLNRKQYASTGRSFSLTGTYFFVEENHTPGNTSFQQGKYKASHRWVQLRLKAEQYLSKGWYKPGYYIEGVLSNQPVFRNYYGTIINAPAFYTLQDSPTLILENFRAFNYMAGGIRNIFTLRPKLDFRLEAYVFKPFEYLQQGSDQEVVFNSDFSTFYFVGTAGLVLHSPIGPVSLSFNYYDDEENQFGVLLHAGFLLFRKHPFE